MSGRINHRGWIVLRSISSADGLLCVDFFEDPAGGFGFEHLRSDPEDGGRWTAVGGFAHTRFDSPLLAADAACTAVSWLVRESTARQFFDGWKRELEAR